MIKKMSNNQENKTEQAKKEAIEQQLATLPIEMQNFIRTLEKEMKREVMKKSREYAQAQKNFEDTEKVLENTLGAVYSYQCKAKVGISDQTLTELHETLNKARILLVAASNEVREAKYNFEDDFKANL